MQPLVEAYLTDLELYRRAKNTITNTRLVLSKFSDGRDILKVNSNDIKIWFRQLNNISLQSQIKYLRYVSIFYDHLIEENQYKEKNPCTKILKELSKSPINRIRETTVLSVEDIRRIVLKASNPRDRSMILLLYKTGIRISELQQLRREDINLEEKIATIKKRKGGKKGIVFFDDECKLWLKAYLGISQVDTTVFGISTRMIENIVHTVGLRAGFEKLIPHDFRHAFTSHLQEARCHPEVIRILRGDSSRDMVSYYTHFSEAKNREEYENCIPKLGV